MPVQKQKSAMAAKYGTKADDAVRRHADDETDYGFVSLPGGIRDGVAQLIEAKFGQYQNGDLKGEYFFRAAGSICEPAEFTDANGTVHNLLGRQTSIMLPVCETKKADGTAVSQEDNLQKILNEMRKLGGDDFTTGAGFADLEDLAAALTEAAPYFKFRTSQGKATEQYPNPRVWENWDGSKGLDDYTPPDPEAAVEETAPAAPKKAASAPAKPSPNGSGKSPPPKKAAPPVAEPEEPEFNEFGDRDSQLDALGAAADDENDTEQEASQAKLKDMALEAGLSEKQINSAESWSAVAEAIKAQSSGDDSSGEESSGDGESSTEEEEATEPTKGDVWLHQPKGAKKPLEVEITAVNSKAKTVACKSLDNPKLTYKDVAWAALKPVS